MVLESGQIGRQLSTLLSHSQFVEPQPSFTNDQQKRYTCTICDYSVPRLDNFKRHMRRHTGQMHQCDICGAQFVCRYGMQKHKEQKHSVGFDSIHGTPGVLDSVFSHG